jgi:hypothetical protein
MVIQTNGRNIEKIENIEKSIVSVESSEEMIQYIDQRENVESKAFLLNLMNVLNTGSFEPVVRDYRGGKLIEYLGKFKGLTSLQKEVLIGILLGDACLQTNKGTNCFLKYDQEIKNHTLVSLVYLIFQDFVGTPPSLRLKGGIQHSSWFRTYRLRFLKFYHDQFYGLNAHGKSVRRVPMLLHRWITPISLAFWFMDDGSKDKSGYLLHTQCFTHHEQKLLQQVLGKKFGLEVAIHNDRKGDKTYYRLYITAKSVPLFNKLVSPYIIPCMQYKLHHV